MNETTEEKSELPLENKSGSVKGKKIGTYAVIIIALLVAGSYYYQQKKKEPAATVNDALKSKAEAYINENLVPSGGAKVANMVKDGDVYKMDVIVGSNTLPAYMSLDGTKLFTQAFELDKPAEKQPQEEAKEVTQKKDVPEVELFVMSYCPYGLQMEKGILPVVNTLGSKMNFQLKFVDYTLHGEKEVKENLAQYCIGKEEPAKLMAYLECFNKSGDSLACRKSVNINTAKLSTCSLNADKQFKLTDSFKAGGQTPAFDINKEENDKYGVKGSPTLVINGEKIAAARDSASLLKTICSAFNNQPEECKKELSSQSPSAGFDSQAGSTAAGNCATQ